MTKTYMKQDYRDSGYNCKDHGGPDLCIGKEFDLGQVLAFGWYTEDVWSVFMLVPDCKRRIGWGGTKNANYAIGFLDREGSFENVTFHANIVEAAEAYSTDYGQDI